MTDTIMPVVSICIQTYQHSAFIKDCLEGILSQKTGYPYEILLGEDGSTDGTREICIDYAQKYPEKIRLFLHNRENIIYINGKPTGRYNFIYNLTHVVGKYIAICEGDDYWTDSNKLQKQVDYLENNSDYAICFHAVDLLVDGNLVDDYITDVRQDTTTILDLAKCNYIHTPSVVYRNNLPSTFPDFIYTVPVADYPLNLFMARYGKIKYFPEKMAVYRIHPDSRWSSMSGQKRLYEWLEVLQALLSYFEKDGDISEGLRKQRVRMLMEYLQHYTKTGEVSNFKEVASRLISLEPHSLIDHICDLYRCIEDKRRENILLQHRMARIVRHPVAGAVISALRFLKRDKSFGELDD